MEHIHIFNELEQILISNAQPEGGSYIQLPKDLVDSMELKFIKHVDKVLNTNFIEDGWHRQGFIGRIINDSNDKDLYKLWYFFMRIDEKYRIWEQTHYSIYYKKYEDDAPCENEKFYTEYPQVKALIRDNRLNKIL